MKTTLKLLSVFSLLLVVLSCDNDDSVAETEPVETPMFLQKATVRLPNNNIYYILENFYADNKLTSQNLYNNEEELTSVYTYEYNNNLPIRANRYDGNNTLISFILFNYNSNETFISYIGFTESNMTAKRHDITYNANNTITESIYIGDYTIQSQNIEEKNYQIDDNGNIVTLATSDYSITYSYDDKNGIFKNIASKNILNLASLLNDVVNAGTNNNALSFEYNGSNIFDHVDLTYTYNENNYPISRTEESNDFGPSLTTEYIYY